MPNKETYINANGVTICNWCSQVNGITGQVEQIPDDEVISCEECGDVIQ